MFKNWFKHFCVMAMALVATSSMSFATVVAYDGFNYTAGAGLNGQNGGTGFGSNAWAAVSGNASPLLASGSMTYTDSASNALPTTGNKLTPAVTSRSTRNLSSTLATANTTLWVSFRINQTDTSAFPSNHAGFSLFSGTNGSGTEIFLGKPASATNWGVFHSSGTTAQRTPDILTTGGRDAFLLYRLVFTGSQVTISMWVNPVLNEGGSLPSPHATTPAINHSAGIASVRISTGGNSLNYQFDELRLGTTFADVTGSLLAADSFSYTGSLNTQNGGSGFSGAWTAVSGQNNPALATGSMTFNDGSRELVTAGNKIVPVATSRSTRNLASAISTTNTTLWVSFRVNQTGSGALPSNHAGFSLFSGTGGTGTEIFLGKPASATNWGMFHSTGTTAQRNPDVVTTGGRNAFLVYKLVFSGSQLTMSMWVNPALNGGTLGTPHATTPAITHSTGISSVRISTGGNSLNYEFDELRVGTNFAQVAPYTNQTPPSGPVTLKVLSWNIYKSRGTDLNRNFNRTAQNIVNSGAEIVGMCEVMDTTTHGGVQIALLEQELEQITGVEWYGHWKPGYSGDDEGNGILSKYPFVIADGTFLGNNRSAARVQINKGGKVVDFVATHLDPDSASIRATQVSNLLTYASGLNTRRIIVGDFNAEVHNSDIAPMTTDYYDAWAVGYAANPKYSIGYSDNTTGRTRKYRIDFVFYRKTSDLDLQQVQVPDLRDPATFNGTAVGAGVVTTVGTTDDKGVRPSDHNQVIATFEIP